MDRDRVRRLITNQRHEHVPHAFRAGHSGMQDFNELVLLLKALPPAEMPRWLDLIDEVARSHGSCLPCLAKITAYRCLITQGIAALQTHHDRYLQLYAQILARQHEGDRRDFMREILDSMHSAQDHPHRGLYRAWWQKMEQMIQGAGRHQLHKNGLGLNRGPSTHTKPKQG